MKCIALGVVYRGDAYNGWQRQLNAPSVQADLETALSTVADRPVTVAAAGRTDTGVHATCQIVSFETVAERPLKAWRLGTNANCTDALSVSWAREVDVSFHARFSAVARRYTYIWHVQDAPSPLLQGLVTPSASALDADAMHRAAQRLVGEHDFSSFRGAGCQSATPHRRVNSVSVRCRGELVVLEIEANAYLLHMVRNIAGVLEQVGRHVRPEEWVPELLLAHDRSRAARTAPPAGLYLTGVRYPDVEFPVPPHPAPLAGIGP